MESKSTRNFFAEYLITQSIEEANAAKGPIKYSKGRVIRDDIMREMGSYNFEMKDLLPVIQDKLAKHADGYQLPNVAKFYNEKVQEFQNHLTSNMLPLPIYDGRFARNEVVKVNAPEQLVVKVDDVEDLADGKPSNLRDPDVMRKIDVYLPRTYGEPKELGKLASESDLSGVSQLSKYMSQDEYNDVKNWVNMVGKDDPNQYMTQKGVNRAVAILDYLNEQGTPYTIERDMNPGQIQAKLTGTNLKVRLTDSRDNEHYVGRVTDRGAAIYYTTDYQASPKGAMDEYKNITDTEAIRLLRFAQGLPIADTSTGAGERAAAGQARLYTTPTGRQRNAVYYTDRGEFSAAVKDYEKPGVDTKGAKVFIHVSKSGHRAQNRHFADVTDAQSFLKTAVDNARVNYADRFELDRLITEFKDNKDDETFKPQFSPDTEVAQLQQRYWDFMKGDKPYLVNPWIDEERYVEDKAELDAIGMPDLMADEVFHYSEDADVEGMVREHFNNVLDTTIGQYDAKTLPYHAEDGSLDYKKLRFDPVNVGKYMTSEYGNVRNNRDIIHAMRLSDVNPDELQGSAFYNKVVKDNLIKFDEQNARDMSQIDTPFMKDMYNTINSTLRRNGVNPDRVLIDDNGVVRYSGQVAYSKNLAKGSSKPIMGEIGQIFEPREDGSIETKYAGGDNHIAVPGYEATIVPQKEGEDLNYIERTRLKGYQTMMKEAIQYQIRTDLIDVDFQNLTGAKPQAGTPNALNSVYRRLYDERHDLNFKDKEVAVGLDENLIDMRTRTESQRVKYANKYGDESTINADFQAKRGIGTDIRNDNFTNIYELTGNENMGVMKTQLSNGYYDPIATSGGTNQGLTRYLVDSASVDAKGRIVKGDENDRTSLMKHEFMKNQQFNPFDRQQMTFSNLMTASGVVTTRAAQIDLNGFTFEDGIPMSKEFAEKNGVYDTNGKLRELLIGDKGSDGNGNKGVVPVIVDRNMGDDEFSKLSPLMKNVVQTFKNNPDLDIVMAKYSSVSRFNGGTARDMVESPNKSDFVDLQGNVHKDSISELPMIITHMTVDAKTNIYDSDALAAGRGRKANPQLAWALNAMNADGVMAEFYGNNNKAVYNYREYLITVGLDMDEIGTLRDHYEPHKGEERNVMEIPELKFKANGTLHIGEMRAAFGEMADDKGGFLAVPFEMKFPNGQPMPKNDEGKTLVPILSSHLRSGQEFADGTTSNHDYTNNYLNMYMKCVQYCEAEQRLADPDLDPKKRATFEARLQQLPDKAQDDYDRIANDVIKRQFEGKHNYVRDGIMSNKLPHSATAVWVADPELKLDEVAISPAIAENLGVRDGNHIAVWRDPVLADGGVRGLKVVVKDDLVGCAIHPSIAQSFEGDFDGDSVALVAVKSRAAKDDLRNKLSQEANILDRANFVEIEGKQVHPININFGLELKVYASEHPEFTETINDMTLVLNDVHDKFRAGEISRDEMLETNRDAVKQLSSHMYDAFVESNGRPLSYENYEKHLQSVMNEVVLTGAKGSASKVQDYMKYLGVEGTISEDGKVDVTKVHDKSLATATDHENTQYAKEVQAYGTGIAGKFSQRGIAALRNHAAKEVLDLTHPITQAPLQAKHDPIDAAHKYEMLMTTGRSIWRGQSVEKTINHEGESVWVPSDDKKQMRADDWVDKFCEFHNDKDGMNIPVNREFVENIAKVLSDKDGYIMNIETTGFEELAAPMDKLSYIPSGRSGYELAQELAKENANLFEGKYNVQFAPSSIQKNMQALEAGTDMKALVKQDVIVKDTPQTEVVDKPVAKTVEPQQSSIPDVVSDLGKASRNALIEQMLEQNQNSSANDGPSL